VQSPPLGGLTFGKPRPLTLEEIEDVVARFAYAAKVLYDAGADGVQLHAAVSRIRLHRAAPSDMWPSSTATYSRSSSRRA
jgi:hypothetical protein